MEQHKGNIPPRLRGLEIGDVLVVRDYNDLVNEFGPEMYGTRTGWNQEMRELCGNFEFTVNETIMDRIIKNRDTIVETRGSIYGWFSIGIDILRFKDESKSILNLIGVDEEETKEEEPILVELNLTVTEKDEETIQKMISMVDADRLRMLMSVAGSFSDDKKIASKAVVDQYLKAWAESKYEFFVMFGEKLKIEQEISFEVDKTEMKAQLVELCTKFNKYAATIDRIHTSYWINNEMDNDDLFSRFVPNFKKGIKVSRFLSQYLKDKEFDIEVSKVLQNRVIKGKIVISIDPYDYLTMSVNQHEWRSCHYLGDGDYATGCLGYMIDDSTLMAYRDNGKEYDYNMFGFKFKGNSKSWRQLVFVDKKTCGIIFGRQYPNSSDALTQSARYLIEEYVSNHFSVENRWYKRLYVSNAVAFRDLGSLHYSDIDGGRYDYVRHKYLKSPEKVFINIGKRHIWCVRCGNNISYNSYKVSCC